MKYSFFADYSEGAHPEILKCLVDHNDDQDLTYGNDKYCALASKRILKRFNIKDGEVHFISSGTLANVVGLSSMLKPFEGIIAPSTGHINVHEAGAIEAVGHKIIYLDTPDGKLTPDHIEKAMLTYEDEHTVIPRILYLTQSTETANLYTKAELKSVIDRAKFHGLYVFVDGARLPMAFASAKSDMTPEEFGALGIDMFYIGGTKNGGLFGEAIVITNPLLQPYFRNHMKQRGAILGKARAIGAQFARFFDEDDLFIKVAKHACKKKKKMYDGLVELGIEFENEALVNQIFPIFETVHLDELEKLYGFYRYEKIGNDKQKIRLVISWATPQSAIEEFLKDVKTILG